MNKKLTLLLCSLVAAAPVKARFSDGMIVGGMQDWLRASLRQVP